MAKSKRKQSNSPVKIQKRVRLLLPPPPILPINAPVPPANTSKLSSFAGPSKDNRSNKSKLQDLAASAENVALKWLKNAPIFKIKDVKLSVLKERAKNAAADIAFADTQIEAMKDLPADACSGRFLDEDGFPLACVFSHAVFPAIINSTSSQSPANIPYYPGPSGRTVEDLNRKKKSKKWKVMWDGIPTQALTRYHEGAQNLHSKMPPVVPKRDIRHPNDALTMSYPSSTSTEYIREGVDKSSAFIHERTHERAGVTHLVHCWFAQGHRYDPMTASSDCFRSGKGAHGMEHYYQASEPVALWLSACFKATYPEYFQTYSEAFKAGVWIESDPGPWIGRVIVWKLQVNTHQDGLDDGPTAIFNCGRYRGGELYLPDLGLKLLYGPGALVIFMAGQLYHRIGKWEAVAALEGDAVTPGRIGNVFFFPQASLNELKGKPAGWFKTSGSGLPTL